MQKKLPIPDNLPNHLTDIFYHININLPKGDLKETVELDKAINQVNASDVYALQDYPLHNLSEYAGWALNSETTQSASKDSPLLITHWYYWGQQLYRSINPYKLDLKTPSLLEIPAYTKLPESLDSVIAEQDERLDLSDTDAKKITGSIPAMHGVIPKGSIFKQGDVILKKDEKLTPPSTIQASKVLLIGMGAPEEFTLERIKTAIKTVVKTTHQLELKSVAFAPSILDTGLNPPSGLNEVMLQALKEELDRHHQLHLQNLVKKSEIERWVFDAGFQNYDAKAEQYRVSFSKIFYS